MEFDEESVGRERRESILRAQKARDLVQKQARGSDFDNFRWFFVHFHGFLMVSGGILQ